MPEPKKLIPLHGGYAKLNSTVPTSASEEALRKVTLPQNPSHIANRAMTRLTASLALLLSLAVPAEDWPQFRGPRRDAVWNETGILKSFPAEGLKIRWRVSVGPGWSSPVVVRGRVYLTDMRLEKPKAWERIQCFKESTGKRLWSYASELVYPEWAFIPEHGGGPAATPIVEDGKIYSLATFLFTDQGNLILARLAPGGYREISRSRLIEPTSILGARKFAWAPPAYANRQVFARNDEELVCASLAAKP